MRHLRATFTAAVAALSIAAASAAGAVTLNRGNGAEPDTLDPHKATGQWENAIIGDMMMGLMTEDAKGQPIPGMAESYVTSPDGLVWTFKLRPDAVWSDGQPVTAEDFVYGLRRINDPATASQYASLTHLVKNAAEANAGKAPLDAIGARAIDDKTLELTLAHTAPYLPDLLTHYTFFPVPKHVVEQSPSDWVKAGKYVSNGAYTLAEWRPNAFVKVVKNPRFFDAANVKIDEVFYYSQEDQVANVKRFRAGELDLSAGIPGQLLDELKRSMPDNVRIAPYIANWYVVVNVHQSPFDDVRVRTALSLAIDREQLTDRIMKGGETPAYTFVPPTIPNYPHTARLSFKDMPMRERQAKARALLAEAGFSPANPLTFEFLHMQSTDGRRIAAALQSMWRQVGVNMTPAGQETKTVYTNLRQQNFSVALAGWIADYPDPSAHLYLAETSAGEMNYAKYSNPEYDRLNLEADAEPDAVKRGELLSRAEQILLDDAPMIPLYDGVSRNLVAPYVKGWDDALTNNHRTRWMSIER